MDQYEMIEDIMERAKVAYQAAAHARDLFPKVVLTKEEFEFLRDLPDDAPHMDHVIVSGGENVSISIFGVRAVWQP